MIEQCWLFHCGYTMVPEAAVLSGGEPLTKRRLPYLCMLLIHERLGPMLIDAPFGHEGPSNLGALLGKMLRSTGTVFKPEWAISARIEQLGLRPGHVEHVFMTHLHFDHTGGMKALSHATFHTCTKEWEHAIGARPFEALRQGYVMGDYRALESRMDLMELPQFFDRYDDGHDIFGDGSVEAFALPGHTVGHTGYRIKLSDGRRIFHMGDAIYNTDMLRDVDPGPMASISCANKDDLLFTMQELRRYRELCPDDIVACSHDFELGEQCFDDPMALHNP